MRLILYNFRNTVVKPYLIDPEITKDMQPEDNKNELLLPQTEPKLLL
jgi:hypothetical protein